MGRRDEPRPGEVRYVSVDGGEPVRIETGSENVFADLGFDDPEEELAKARLTLALGKILRSNGWSQAEAARRTGVSQPVISRLLRGKTAGVSSDRLLRMIADLGRDVDIVIRESDGAVGRINVLVTQ